MEENKDKAVQEVDVTSQSPATSPVENNESLPDQVEAPKDAAQVESASPEGKPKGEEVKSEKEATPGGHRSTRSERRIQSLLEKLKATQTQTQAPDPQVLADRQPLITDDEKATGAIDPEALQARFDAALKAERLNLKSEVMRDLEAQNQFKSTITENLGDLESTQKAMAAEGNQDLEDMIAEQYRLANYSIDPYTGQEVFIPRVKMSQLYEKQKALLEKRTTARVAATNTRLADIVSESAGVVGSSTESSEQNDLSESFEKARESGSDDDWASYLKKTGIAKV